MSNSILKSTLRLLILIPCVMLMVTNLSLKADAQPKKLVILNSYNESAAWSQEITAHIMNYISTLDTVVQTDVIHLNNALIHDAEQFEQMAQGVFMRYPHESAPDYAILIGNMSFSLRDRIEKNWGRLPMILIAQNDKYGPQDFYYTYSDSVYPYSAADMQPLEPLQEKYNFTLVHIPNLYRQTIDMMLYMFPDMKKLVFMADEIYINHGLNADISSYVAEKYPELQYEWLMGNRYNGSKMNDYLNNPDFNIGLLLSTWFYEQTSVFGYPTLVSGDTRMISGARRPIFSLRSAYFQLGVTGGYFPSPEEVFANITDAVSLLVAGYDMGHVPFYYPKESFPIVNYRQLTKDGLSVSICPPDTVFEDRPESFWEANRALIISSAIGLIALISLAIGYMVFQRQKIRLLNAQKALVSSMPIAYTDARVIYDSKGNVKDIEYTNSNDAFLQLIRETQSNSESRQLFYREHIASLIEQMISKHVPVRFNYYFKSTDRYYEIILSIPDADIKDRIANLPIFAIDVTDKSKAENELREFARKLDITLNVARIIPWRWDLTSGKISCEVQRVLTHADFDTPQAQSQIINIIDEKEYFSHVHPEDIAKVKETYNQLVNGKLQYTKLEYRYLWDKHGTPHIEWIEVNAGINTRDEYGHPTGIIGSMLIITQRKQQEEQLVTARARAQESDRLKSAFLANMSHEIRTPLNAIVGFSNLLTKNPDHAKRDKFVNIIENNNQLLLQLISDVLDLSKVESNTLDFKFAPTDINELLSSIESTVQIKLQPGVALNVLPGAPDFIVDTDKKRLSQVLINLLTNACKFTSKGNISFGYELRDSDIYFFVKDTGVGISEEDLPKLFHRFVKLDTFVQGTGLGLSICKHIVEKLGGQIGAESRGKGKGSIFWFTIPYSTSEQPVIEEAVAAIDTPKEEMRREELSILIAEDNESNYLLFQSILENDYRIIHAWNGDEAVRLYDQFRPALIIMDINMPVMDGYEATRKIRQLSSSVPIIAVTAYAYASDQDKILENGFNGYVSKPVNPEKLTQELQSMIRNRFVLV